MGKSGDLSGFRLCRFYRGCANDVKTKSVSIVPGQQSQNQWHFLEIFIDLPIATGLYLNIHIPSSVQCCSRKVGLVQLHLFLRNYWNDCSIFEYTYGWCSVFWSWSRGSRDFLLLEQMHRGFFFYFVASLHRSYTEVKPRVTCLIL